MTTPTLDKTQEKEAPAAELYQLLQQLTAPQLAQVQTFAEFLLHQQKKQTSPPQRTPGLHQGAVLYIADDFDDDLGDEFWFPEGDILTAETE
ncbi:MAG: DUF2281 domain-containing protein [Anaerolineales bacterium]|nr:DUF2281 domain-containing protein [Anaerolineales bacterium]